MDLELEDIFQWQTPFCTLLGDIGDIDAEHGIDSMLDQIELPEIQEDGLGMMPGDGVGDADVVASSTALSSSRTFTGSAEEPVSSPLWPCDLHAPAVDSSNFLAPMQGSGAESAADYRLDSGGSSQSCTAQTNSLTASQGSHKGAPVTPPAAKPKRTRATKVNSKKSAPKAKKARQTVAEQSKESRLATQAEHIMRERQRRDDMAAKYTILESLLPAAPKRERAVVVETAISFVKDLQQKRIELLKRRAHLKLMAPSQSPRQVQSKQTTPLHDSSGVVTASCKKLHPGEFCGTDSPMSSPIMAQRELITSSPTTTIPATMSTVVEDLSSGSVQHLLQVHVHFSEKEIVIEMVCHRPRQNFQSFLLQAVESFGLDITRCSINRVPHGFVQCSITCTKSQGPNSSLTSSEIQTSATLIGALRKIRQDSARNERRDLRGH
ncbi:hypothetical protein M758_12G003000 [Ceratodon purpureus]|uniref:BHLH domain-containing protein n=1 Tax=Ceratodon purpureus TaxID=3225 RepID=A0A8T0G4A1_CERPU|nr:hypothetical protein KC19_12G002400 [Ceratodon purpureus]KAG0597542.1 hypothetical protein M758_12G003000 [Ceratodon purpureus]